jgi:hypothetical protein
MIKHIVVWTVKEGDSSGMKSERMEEMKFRLMGLKDQINEIVSFEVNFNSPRASESNYDIILQSEFRTWADLESYQNHPAHVEVAEYIKNIRGDRASIDFEF